MAPHKMKVLNKPKIAILLAAYNGVRWLPEQLDSILTQEDIDVTIFASVDKSTDGTEAWFDNISAQDSRVIVLPHGHKFGGAAPNFFRLIKEVEFAGFNYVGFADQDDIWNSDKLKRAATILSDGLCDAYSSNVTAFWSSGKEKLVFKSQSQRKWDFLFEAAGPGCTYLFSIDLANAIKKCVIKNWHEIQNVSLHDWFTYAFSRANNFKWFIDDIPSILYRQHDDNQFGANSGLKAFSNRLKMFINGFWLSQGCLLASLIDFSDNQFYKRWSSLSPGSILWLAFNANQCRRRIRDRFLFFFVCILSAAKKGARF